MGLKSIVFGPYKSTKTTFCLTMAEAGPLGAVDTEGRWQWLTIPHPTIKPGTFPFDNPRQIRPDLTYLPKIEHPIYLVETQQFDRCGKAMEGFTSNKSIVSVCCDSDSVIWDLLQDTRDTSDPRVAMLAWGEVKRFWRRLHYAMASGNKHLVVTAHAQDIYKKVGSEIVTVGTKPWLEKKTPHWVELILELQLPEAHVGMPPPSPQMKVIGEGIGGVGGLHKGAIIETPTFMKILNRVKHIPTQREELTPGELDYRNAATVAKIAGSPKPTSTDS